MKSKHIPVLKKELIECLNIKPGMKVLDATLGGGSHLLEVLAKLEGKGQAVTFDLSQEAIKVFGLRLKEEGFNEVEDKSFEKNNYKVKIINDNFGNVSKYFGKNDSDFDIIYADLGLSSDQIDSDFSYKVDGELDLRMDKSMQVKAKDLVNGMYRKELERLFNELSDEPLANQISKKIVEARKEKLIETKFDLNKVIRSVVDEIGISKTSRNFNPEPRIYQALRIAINDEFGTLKRFIGDAFELLKPGGVFGIISFHSGEDRIVKTNFKKLVDSDKAVWIEKLITPTETEIRSNKRSKPAKLRIIRKN